LAGERVLLVLFGNGEKHTLIKTQYRQSFVFKLLGNDPLLITLIAYLSAPMIAIIHAIEGKSLLIYFYYIVRQYAILIGFLYGLVILARKMKI